MAAAPGYSVIDNIAFLHGGRRIQASSREQCENHCDQMRDCNGFSYRAGDRRCVITKRDLRWDTKWQVNIKQTKMTDSGEMKHTGKWTKLESIGYIDNAAKDPKTGLFEKRNMDFGECQMLCGNLKRCNAFSYNNNLQECVMDDDDIQFNSAWSFYAKNHPVKIDEEADLGEGMSPTQVVENMERGLTKKVWMEEPMMGEHSFPG